MGLQKMANSMLIIEGHKDMLYTQHSVTIRNENDKRDFIHFVRMIGYQDLDLERPVEIDPYFGSYGLTGFVFTVQGTPTQAMAVIDLERGELYVISINGYSQVKRKHIYKVDHPELYGLAIRMLAIANLPTEYSPRSEPNHAAVGLPFIPLA